MQFCHCTDHLKGRQCSFSFSANRSLTSPKSTLAASGRTRRKYSCNSSKCNHVYICVYVKPYAIDNVKVSKFCMYCNAKYSVMCWLSLAATRKFIIQYCASRQNTKLRTRYERVLIMHDEYYYGKYIFRSIYRCAHTGSSTIQRTTSVTDHAAHAH